MVRGSGSRRGRGCAAEGGAENTGCGGGDSGCAFGGSEARGGGGLLASSSAIMRRMEARISSIDGSCDFAGCVIRTSLPCVDSLARPVRPQRITQAQLCNVAREYVMAKVDGKKRSVDLRSADLGALSLGAPGPRHDRSICRPASA